MHKNRISFFISIFVLFSILSEGFIFRFAKAQVPTTTPTPLATGVDVIAESDGEIWSQPVNLSQSGAATQPYIFAARDGRIQVFWLDRFDGLMTALYNGELWSFPVQTTRPTSFYIVKPKLIDFMPSLSSDLEDRIHAFWSIPEGSEEDKPGLYYNQIQIGQTEWTAPSMITDSAPVFKVASTSSGELQLAIIRTLKTEADTPEDINIPPGIYSSRSSADTKSFGPFHSIETSIYYRIIDPESSKLSMAVQDGAVLLAWTEPRLNQTLFSISANGGNTWSAPAPFGVGSAAVKEPLFTILPDGKALRIWQDESQGGCVLFQSSIELEVDHQLSPTQTPVSIFRPTATPIVTFGQWSEPKQIMKGSASCPSESRFVQVGAAHYWVWGENSPTIYLSAWDPGQEDWTLPNQLSFGFEDPETGRPVQLNNLRAAFSGDKIAIAGADVSYGEIWSLYGDLGKLQFELASASPWSAPLAISTTDQSSYQITTALDSQNNAHIIWSQGISAPGTSLYYAREGEGGSIPATEIVRGFAEEIVRQPQVVIDQEDFLNLVYSGGKTGDIFFTRALADQAGTASGWKPPIQISGSGNASWPQIGLDAGGRIYVVYAMPINEKRGIYMVTSDNQGENWTAPALVFDAQGNNWLMADHPTLGIGRDGSVHLAWVRGNPAASEQTEGIFYSRTQGAYQPNLQEQDLATGTAEAAVQDPQWTAPVEIAPRGGDWPKIAFLKDQIHLVYWADGLPNHRWVGLGEQSAEGMGWKPAAALPGWEAPQNSSGGSYALDGPPFALASDYLTVRLMAPIPGTTAIQMSELPYSAEEALWGQIEKFSPPGLWKNAAIAAAMSPATGGRLAIAWLANSDLPGEATPMPSLPQVFFSMRQVEEIDVPPAPTATASPTATLTPNAPPTLAATATPPLDSEPVSNGNPVSPLVIGTGLAALIVIAIFIGVLVRGQQR